MRIEGMRNEPNTIDFDCMNYNINESINELVRVADQANTAISDTFDYEVKLPYYLAMNSLYSVNSAKIYCIY